jgi:hypothetical protein
MIETNNEDNRILEQTLLADINDKMKNKITPSIKDKETLLYKLNKQLLEEDHLYIFTKILQKMERKIYTITKNGTLFDLNDLTNHEFWNIYYHTQMFIDGHKRQNTLCNIGLENRCLDDQFKQKVNNNLQKIKEQSPYISSTLTHYDKLRIDALSHCTYSYYCDQMKKDNDIISSLPHKNIYSDNDHHITNHKYNYIINKSHQCDIKKKENINKFKNKDEQEDIDENEDENKDEHEHEDEQEDIDENVDENVDENKDEHEHEDEHEEEQEQEQEDGDKNENENINEDLLYNDDHRISVKDPTLKYINMGNNKMMNNKFKLKLK